MLNVLRRVFSFSSWTINHPLEPPPGDMLDASFDAQNQKIAELEVLIEDIRRSDGRLQNDTVTYDSLRPELRSALGLKGPPVSGQQVSLVSGGEGSANAEAWADTSRLWAEHMPDTIPDDSLAEMDISGDHWSSRWWAHQASLLIGSRTGGVVVSDEPPPDPHMGILWWSSVTGDLHTWYIDADSAQWVQVNTASDGGAQSWPDRASFVLYVANGEVLIEGRVYTAGGYQYIGQPGATAISDLPGLLPHDDMTPQHFGAVGTGSSADTATNTTAFQAATTYALSSHTPIHVPPGVYCVNCRPDGVSDVGLIRIIEGQSFTMLGVPGASILKNVANNPFSFLSIQGGDDITIDGIEFDMNRQNVTGFTSGGTCILAYNRNAPNNVNRLRLRNLILRNAYGYGIGLQSAYIVDGVIENCSFLSNGNDALDIKPSFLDDETSSSWQKRGLFLKNLYADSVDELGVGGKACFDIRGQVMADGLYCDQIKRTGSATVTGVRFQTEEFSLGREGAKKARASNIIVTCGDDTTVQNTQANANTGIWVAERDVAVVNATVEGFGIGINLGGSGANTSPPVGTGLSNITIRGARTGDGAGRGISIGGSGTGWQRVSAHVEDCDIGLYGAGGRMQGEFIIRNCALGHNFSAAALALSHLKFVYYQNTLDSSEGRNVNFSESVALYGQNNPRLSFQTVVDGTWPGSAPFYGGGLDWWKKDGSGFGAGKIASIDYRFASSAAGSGLLFVSMADSVSTMTDLMSFSTTAASFLKPMVLASGSVPATAGASGVAGQTAYDSGFIYVCTATNVWKRVAIATW